MILRAIVFSFFLLVIGNKVQAQQDSSENDPSGKFMLNEKELIRKDAGQKLEAIVRKVDSLKNIALKDGKEPREKFQNPLDDIEAKKAELVSLLKQDVLNDDLPVWKLKVKRLTDELNNLLQAFQDEMLKEQSLK